MGTGCKDHAQRLKSKILLLKIFLLPSTAFRFLPNHFLCHLEKDESSPAAPSSTHWLVLFSPCIHFHRTNKNLCVFATCCQILSMFFFVQWAQELLDRSSIDILRILLYFCTIWVAGDNLRILQRSNIRLGKEAETTTARTSIPVTTY